MVKKAFDMCEKIDFVIPWLDGNDHNWQALKDVALNNSQFGQKLGNDAIEPYRFRDMGLLKYWFRGVEKYATWVNKVYFITCGQKPEWLNENNPKLVLVNHEDYIPKEFLPTFNSNTIELNLHRIPMLSEKFVLFNDDVFLTKPVSSDMFFKKEHPVLPCNLYICRVYGNNNWSKVSFNNYCVINEHFNISKSIWNYRKKWFSVFDLGFNLAVMNWVRYMVNKTFISSGFEHLANPHLKSTIQEVWDTCPDVMEESSKCRFRSDIQVNHWMMLTWNLVKGYFYPIGLGKRGKLINISSRSVDIIVNMIKQHSEYQLCINDSYENDNPEYCFQKIAQAFESTLPEKSSFEL